MLPGVAGARTPRGLEGAPHRAPSAPPGCHHLNAASRPPPSSRGQIGRPRAAPSPEASPLPAAARTAAPSAASALRPAGRAVGIRASGQSRPLPVAAAAWKELCHARRRAVLRQVSPSVTQLFRVSFLGSRHITRLMSTRRFVINPPARATATDGRW